MADQSLEQAKQDGIEQGKRLQRLEDVENGLADLREALEEHQAQCELKAERLHNEVKELRTEVTQGQKLIYIGIGLLIAVNTAIAALSSMPGIFK